MVGVTHLGTYLPRRRLDRGQIARAWGSRPVPGSRTVAAVDQDALIMSVDAALACMGDADPAGFDGLYFASTSAPYVEKQVASFVATAIDLPRTAAVADLCGSTRAGLAALRAAGDAVHAGSLRHALVAAADVRLAEPGTELEAQLGDGAACVAVGTDHVVAELVSAASVSEEFTYFWRTDEQRYVQVADARFGNQYGVARDVPEAVTAALRKAELPAARVAQLCLAVPDARAAADAAKRIGCDPATQLAPSLVGETGLLGTADALVQLARALETAKPGDFLVVAAYGEGADALVLRATDALPDRRPPSIAGLLEGGIAFPSYERYLRARGVLPADVGGETMPTYIEWKELKQDVRLYGSRCEACGLVQFPQALVCVGCQTRDRMVDAKLAKTGSVFTFTIDNLAQVAEHPMPMVVADLDAGGRVYLQGTDCAEGEIAVGARVRLTFRRLHEAGGNRNYFWKVSPA
jgi:hydroxymethylglutaryl-CoA synthase